MPADQKKRRLTVLVAVIAVLGIACGDDGTDASSDREAGSAATTPEAADPSGAPDEAPDPTEAPDEGAQTGDAEERPGEIVLEGGSATLTIGGEVTELDFFFCAFGYEATEDDEVSFIGIGEGTDASGVPFQLMAQINDSASKDSIRDGIKSVAYWYEDETGARTSGWQYSTSEQLDDLQGVETFVVEGDRVAINGEFESFVGNDADTGEFADGSLDATCSPNSLGSSG